MECGYDTGSTTVYNKAGKLRAGEKEMLSCQHCGKLLREAVQLTTCGCRYCKCCIKTTLDEWYVSVARKKKNLNSIVSCIVTCSCCSM